MTLEEKAAQLFLVTPEALTHNDSVEVAGEGRKNAINTYPIGGMVYSSLNFQDKEQTQELLSGVQQFSIERIGLPLFLAVEEAGEMNFLPQPRQMSMQSSAPRRRSEPEDTRRRQHRQQTRSPRIWQKKDSI